MITTDDRLKILLRAKDFSFAYRSVCAFENNLINSLMDKQINKEIKSMNRFLIFKL